MSFGHRLKTRLYSLQEDISSSVRQLSSTASVTSGLSNLTLTSVSTGFANPVSASSTPLIHSATSPQYRSSKNRLNPEAGSDLLEFYQNQWESLHVMNEKNCKLANNCDRKITELNDSVRKKANDVLTLQMLVSQIPKINEQIEGILNTLGDLEAAFSDTEVALLALEDTIDARELQERQLDQRFQVALYQEKRRTEFEQLSSRLKANYNEKKQEHDRRRGEISRKSKNLYGQDHNLLQVPKKHDPDASLETVDLDDEDRTILDSECPSPLPQDDSSSNLLSEDNGAFAISERANSLPIPRDEESIYFTPDSTIEKLNEV